MTGGVYQVEAQLGDGRDVVFEVLAASEEAAYEIAMDELDKYAPIDINPRLKEAA
jgi:hypothetical protein